MMRLICCVMILASVAAADPPAKVRVGTYDPRAIAVAWAASPQMQRELTDLKRQRDQAKAAGDTQRVADLEARGATMQRKLHLQGFAAAPVDDILTKVKDKLPDAARQANVSLILRSPDFAAPEVEVVDVTDNLLKLFEPSQRTLKMITDLRSKPPLAQEQVEQAEKKGGL